MSTQIYLDNCNVIIASFVITHSQLQLYNLIDSIGENVLYHDTNSCILIQKLDDINKEYSRTLNFLGELTNELSRDNFSSI